MLGFSYETERDGDGDGGRGEGGRQLEEGKTHTYQVRAIPFPHGHPQALGPAQSSPLISRLSHAGGSNCTTLQSIGRSCFHPGGTRSILYLSLTYFQCAVEQ